MSKKKIVFATNNQHKLSEISRMLGDEFEILSLQDIGCNEELPETHDTLDGNAIEKAMYVYDKYGFTTFADDTGLEVDSLNGDPGVYSARYAGEGKKPIDNIVKLLGEMEGMENRKARFRTVIAYVEGGKTSLFEGKVDGTILTELHGNGGFGYDPVFQPEGFDISFAQMDPDDKNRISHRGNAFRKFVDFLAS
ncbi:MAG TPA: non-canonical purine NTP diphosphatase [Bacteroidales bacterium]|nr:non-canonical purine NTP diphosphatase [Bacteroidales bacterium]